MPKKLPAENIDRILAIITRHADGVRADEVLKSLEGGLSLRTLQRKLSELVAAKHIVTEGKARSLRYKIAPVTGESNLVLPAIQAYGEAESYVPLSKEGQEVRDYVRLPIQKRRPTGYDRSFVESYAPNETWYLPAAVREHLHQIGRSSAEARPAGTYARDILGRLLIDLSWASSRLEGNTYTRLETQQLIEFGTAAQGKDQTEAQMILNHKGAIEMLVDGVEEVGFNIHTFCNLHALLSDNLLADPAGSGRIRSRIVEIGGTVYHPLSVPQQIEEYFRLILNKVDAIHDPFEQAFFLMVHIPYLQPFIDVNKRVSRVGANIPMIKHNLCPLSFVDVPERAYIEGTLGVYEMNRIELLRDVFIWAYERSAQRYLAVRETAARPDPVRLRHRETLVSVVGDIVRGMKRPTQENVRALATKLVRAEDIDRFVELAIEDLARLHDGNVARYRLRLSEYRAWLASVGPQNSKH